MPTARTILTFPLALLMTVTSLAAAGQQHIVAPNQLAATVADRVAQDDAARAAIAEALARPEVRDAAASFGVDIARVSEQAAVLSGAQLERAGAAARQVNDRLSGGASTITLTTTTLIIILLLVILLIVALK
jgi:hypothetical protein